MSVINIEAKSAAATMVADAAAENPLLDSLLIFMRLEESDCADAFMLGAVWALWHNKQISRQTAMHYVQKIYPIDEATLFERSPTQNHLEVALADLFDPLETETMLAENIIGDLHDPDACRVLHQTDNLRRYYAGSEPYKDPAAPVATLVAIDDKLRDAIKKHQKGKLWQE